MDISFFDATLKRKSFHLFKNVGNDVLTQKDLDGITDAFNGFTPLYENIKTKIKILPESQTPCNRGNEYTVLFYSEKKDGYLQNIGYLGEQLDLFLVSHGIGSLWYGLGKTKDTLDGLDFVIMMGIKKITDETCFRLDTAKVKRNACEKIWDGEFIEGVTEIARFAPSACNSQPWLVKNEDGVLSVFRYKKFGKLGIMPPMVANYFNQIDMGIFICFLDVLLEHQNIAFKKEAFAEQKITKELLLTAKYELQK